MRDDLQHLTLLSIFHYVLGGLLGVSSCFPIFYLVMGVVIITSPGTLGSGPNAPPAAVGWLFAGFAMFFILVGWSVAVCLVLAGRFLATQRHYTFCLVVAGIICLWVPMGTALGVCTFLVLLRPSVKELFRPSRPVEQILDALPEPDDDSEGIRPA